jgi:hypothetical protein
VKTMPADIEQRAGRKILARAAPRAKQLVQGACAGNREDNRENRHDLCDVPPGRCLSTPLEELHRSLVRLCRRTGLERSQITPPSGSRIWFPRIQTVLTCAELADHVITAGVTSRWMTVPA